MRKLKWMFNQLFPQTYRSHYSTGTDKQFAVWKMWAGRVYKYDCVSVV